MIRHRAPIIQTILLLLVLGPIAVAQSGLTSVDKYTEEGQSALAAGRYGEAQNAYEHLRTLEPGIAEIHANLGLIYFREGLPEQAVASLRKAIELKPALKTAHALLALSLAEAGRYKEALPGLEGAFRESSNPEFKRMSGLELMRAYDNLQRESDAVEVGIALNRRFPDDPEILYQSGRVYGNFAFLTMQRLSAVAPTSVWRQLAAGEAEESAGAFPQALTAYRAVLQIDPQHPGIHYRIARTLEARSQQTSSPDDIQEALKEFEIELQLDPQNANAAYESGVLWARAGQLEKAREFFAEALQHHADFEEAQLGLGGVLVELDKPDLAVPHLKRAAELDPDDEVPYYRLARAYKALGKGAESREAMMQFQRLRTQQRSKEAHQRVSEGVTRQTVELNSKD